MKSRGLADSFRHAADGIIHALHSDWHMRLIFLTGAVVLLLSAILRVTRVELLQLAVALALVIIAELFNCAVEVVVDLACPELDSRAKAAKDLAGAAVLIAGLAALLIAGGVFINAKSLEVLRGVADRPPPHVVHVLVVGAITVLVSVVLAKLWGGHWDLTRGGWMSAHTALAFFCFISVCYLTRDPVVCALSLVLAVLVAQSRVDAGIHTLRDVVIGAAVAMIVGATLYSLLAMRAGV